MKRKILLLLKIFLIKRKSNKTHCIGVNGYIRVIDSIVYSIAGTIDNVQFAISVINNNNIKIQGE